MRSSALRTLLLALLLLTFVGASWVSAFAQTAPQPCPMGMKMDIKTDLEPAGSAPADPMPCMDSTPACAKRICCLIGTALPMSPPAETPVSFGMIQYLPTDAAQGGRSIEPELFPPIHV
jgi:hypothetical protein